MTGFDDLIDPNKPITGPTELLPPSTSPTDLPQTVFENAPGTDPANPAHVEFLIKRIENAGTDFEKVATEFADQIGQVTGVWIAPEAFAEIFETFGLAIARAQTRDLALRVGNYPVTNVDDLQLRTAIASLLLSKAAF